MSKSKENVIPIGNAIESIDISKTYISGEVKVQALKNMNFEVKNGERLVILGPSGSGKTTLLNLLGGITSPDEKKGSLNIFGKLIFKPKNPWRFIRWQVFYFIIVNNSIVVIIIGHPLFCK